MLNAEQARARPYLRQRDIDQDEAFHEFAVLYALRLSRSLTDIAHATDERWQLARHLLPILGVDTELRRGRLPRIASLLANVAAPSPNRAGPAFENIDSLASVLRLNKVETALLDLAVVVAHHGALADALQQISPRSRSTAARMLAWALDCDAVDVTRATSASAVLVRMGFLTPFEPRYRLDSAIDLSSDVLMPLTETFAPGKTILDTFVRTGSVSPLKPESFPHLAAEMEWVMPFLRKAIAGRVSGVNILLYGPPGTGKTEFARMLAGTLECTLAEVRVDDHEGLADDPRGRVRSYQLALCCFQRQGAVVLFDDADEVFAGADVMGVGGEKGYGKSFMNNLLESNAVPTLWTVNDIEAMELSYRRRFDHSIAFATIPYEVRIRLFDNCFSGLALPQDVKHQLAEQYALTPSQIARAARTARIADVSNDDLAAFVRRGIEQSSQLLGLGADSIRDD